MKKWFILLIMTPFALFGQNHPTVPTTPEAASLGKMSNYPMTNNTGVPDINIPLHEVRVGGIVLPITLSYHAGGFKYNEKSTSIGMGWNLSTDIQISRSINGMDDFGPYGYINSSYGSYNTIDGGNSGYFNATSQQNYNLAAGLLDGKPDKFSYKLLNKSGSFYILKTGGTYSFIPVPYDNIRITYSSNQFVIVDNDGTTYYFSLPGSPPDIAGHAAAGREMTGQIDAFGGCIGGACSVTAWKCMSVVNATRTDTINFNYSLKTLFNTGHTSDFLEYYTNPTPCQGTGTTYYPDNSLVSTALSFNQLMNNVGAQKNLSTPRYMEYKDGYAATFHMWWKNPAHSNALEEKTYNVQPGLAGYSDARRASGYNLQGLALTSITFRGGSVTFSGTKRLDGINVYNNGAEVKTIVFYNFYSAPADLANARIYNGQDFYGALYLDSIHITKGGVHYEKYGFLYKNKFCFGDHLKGHDAWGYVNNKTMEISQAGLYPAFISSLQVGDTYVTASPNCVSSAVTVPVSGFGDEYPDETKMQSGILSRIAYPMGGYADFDFEANRFSASYTDNFGTSKRLMLGGGLRLQKVSYYDGTTTVTPALQRYYVYGDLEDGEGTLLNSPILKYVDGQPLYGNYSFTQRIYYGSSLSGLTTSGTPISTSEMPAFATSCIAAGCVTLIKQEDRTIYIPNSELDLSYAGGSPIYYGKVTEYQLDLGKRAGKTVSTYYPPDNFKPSWAPYVADKSMIANTDDKLLRESWYIGALKDVSEYKFQNSEYAMIHQKAYEYSTYVKPQWPRVIYSFLHNIYSIVEPGASVPTNCYMTAPSGTGSIIVTPSTDFITYQNGIAVGKLLMTREIEKWVGSAGDTLTQSNQFQYSNSTYLQPTTVTSSNGKGAIRIRQLKYPYDYPADPTYTAMVNLNILTPVVESIVTDGSREFSRLKTNFSYTNNAFYVPSTVQSSYRGRALETETSYGKYDSYGNVQEFTGRDGVIHSFLWGYQSRYPVAEVTGMPYNTASANITMSVLNSPASDQQLMTELNKIRARTGTYLVKSFTYKPLIGVSSITDARGVPNYIEYDGFNRPTVVRNAEHNIVKMYEYNLSGPSGAARNYFNRPVMVTKCNCFVDATTASLNNYVIPGGSVGGADFPYADQNAISGAVMMTGNGSINPACASDTSNRAAIIKLGTLMLPMTAKPNYVIIEFIHNGSVVASEPYGGSDDVKKYIYLPEGTYQLSFRTAPDYRGRAVKFYMYRTDAPNDWVIQGATVTLQKKLTYEINATNEF